MRPWYCLVLACAACGGVDEQEHVGTTEQAVTNADNDDQDPAVVALLVKGQVLCTGFLVTSHVVVTAGHCLSPNPPDQVYFGTKPSTNKGSFIGIADTVQFPDFDEDTLDNDIGLVALADTAPTKPLPINTREMDGAFVKMGIRLVGFGSPAANDDGNIRKRSGKTAIDSYEDDFFHFVPGPSQTCSGDSGGPALAMIDGREAVVGITSSGDADCKRYGRDLRVDRYVPFITDYAKAYSKKIAASSGPSGGCAIGVHRPASPSSLVVASLLAIALLRRRAREATPPSAR
jgi:secreted trypsin-like serine protease